MIEMKKVISIVTIGIICIIVSAILFNYAENAYKKADLIKIEFNEVQNETENGGVFMVNTTTNVTMYYIQENGVRINYIIYPEHIYNNEKLNIIMSINNSGQSKNVVVDCCLSVHSPMDLANASIILERNELFLEENVSEEYIISCDKTIDMDDVSYGEYKLGIYLTSEFIEPEYGGTIFYSFSGAIPLEIRGSENIENISKLSIALFSFGIILIISSMVWHRYRRKMA